MEGRAPPTSCPGRPPDNPSLGGQAANWDSTVMLVRPVVEEEVRVSLGAVKSHQRTGTRMGSTSLAAKKILRRAFAVSRRLSVWRP